MYVIKEILEFNSDDGILYCVFKIDGDEPKTARVISDDSYYDKISHLTESNDYYINSLNEDDIDDFNPTFDFESWKSENETEEFITNFIYENYQIEDLPEPESIKK